MNSENVHFDNEDVYFVVDKKDGAGVKIMQALNDIGIEEDHVIENRYGDNNYGWNAMCPKIQEALASMQVASEEAKREAVQKNLPDPEMKYIVYGVGVPENSKPQDYGPNVVCKNLYTDSQSTYMEKAYYAAAPCVEEVGIGLRAQKTEEDRAKALDKYVNGVITTSDRYMIAYIRDPKHGMDEFAAKEGHTMIQKKAFKDAVRSANQEAQCIRQEGPDYERAEAYAAILKDQSPIVSNVRLIDIPNELPKEYENINPVLIDDILRQKQMIYEEPSLINCQDRKISFVGNEEIQSKLHGIEAEDGAGIVLKQSNAPLAQKDIDAVTKGVTGLAEKDLLVTNPAVTHNAVENDHTMSGDMVNAVTGIGQSVAETASEVVENAPDNYELKTFQDGKTRVVNESEEAQVTGTEVVGSPDGVNEETVNTNIEAESESEEEEEEKKAEKASAQVADAAENLVEDMQVVSNEAAVAEEEEMEPELGIDME